MSMNGWSDAIASAAPATTGDMNFAVTLVNDMFV